MKLAGCQNLKTPDRLTRAEVESLIHGIPGYDPEPKDPTKGYRFDWEKAKAAIRFLFHFVTHREGVLAGKPLILEPWQAAFVANIYGWVDREGLRRFRDVLIYIPRKNGKTVIAAGLCLLCIFGEDEGGIQAYCAASDRDQALLVFRHVESSISNKPDLEKACSVYASSKTVVLPSKNATFKAISADVRGKHGYNSNLVLVDELHQQPDRELVDTLRTSMGSRRQPLMIYLTTADYLGESICNETYDYAKKVRDGFVPEDTFLPVIYEAGEDEDWHSEDVWWKANPNLGVSVSLQFLRDEHKRAVEIPAFENTFKRLYLNIRTEQDVRWLPTELWDNCPGVIDMKKLEGKPCWGGLDLATTSDLCSLVLLFAEEENWPFLLFNWCPRLGAEKREKKDRVPYMSWARQGLITLTPGNQTDYDYILNDVVSLREEKYDIREIAIDRWNSTQLQNDLTGAGFTVVPYNQGFTAMNAPMVEIERRVQSRDLNHGGNPVMRWMFGNIAIAKRPTDGYIRPDKNKSSEKIDGFVALAMAVGRGMVREETVSPYENGGVCFL